MNVKIADFMENSGVKFGTSGARGLVVDMTDRVCFAYTTAFLDHLESQGLVSQGARIAVAGDYRPSTPRMMQAVGLAIEKAGFKPVNCGFVPTPAVAAYAMKRNIPGIMITGSHIPDDRNGIKFYRPDGEILKRDEQGMCSRTVALDEGLFDGQGMMKESFVWAEKTHDAYTEFVQRYASFFPQDCMKGQRIGVYGHSSVARDILVDVMRGLAADVVKLGFSDTFIPVDTEAVREEDVKLAKQWVKEHTLDCIVSADGDGDRPLVSDEKGVWLRGDVAGIVCAKYLAVAHVVTPVSSNTAVEKSGYFKSVRRTRIGSPFVIEAMNALLAEGKQPVAGYEANGGFLVGSDIRYHGRVLAALPTRDAVIVPLTIIMASIQADTSISDLMQTLPRRFTASDRLQGIATVESQTWLADLRQDMTWLTHLFGKVKSVDETDGFRVSFVSEEVVHLRPSGNAPELRCYVEAADAARAEEMLNLVFQQLTNIFQGL